MAGIDIFIGEQESDHILIHVASNTDQVVRDYWDANWLACVVSVNVGGWKGTNEKAFFRTEELSRFREKIELLAEGRLHDTEFAPMEPHLLFKMRAEDAGGPVSISGTAIDRLEGGNTLAFGLLIARSTLPDLAAQLAAVEQAFPTIGKS